MDVLGVNALSPHPPEELPQDAEAVVEKMWECWQGLSRKSFMEAYHDALEYKDEALSLFKLGHLSLEQRVHVENLFWALNHRILKLTRELPYVPEDLKNLEKAISDTYFCNFSIFQSLPDAWAVKQLFPVMPIQRLDEEPTRRGVLADITCDSDGEISQFIDMRDVKSVLELHEHRPGEPYLLAFFLVGAYQEILGDLHNLFGDANEVHVSVQGDDYQVDHVVEGDSITDVLMYVGYDRKKLVAKVRQASEVALREKRMTLEESRNIIRVYEAGLSGYTYLEQ